METPRKFYYCRAILLLQNSMESIRIHRLKNLRGVSTKLKYIVFNVQERIVTYQKLIKILFG